MLEGSEVYNNKLQPPTHSRPRVGFNSKTLVLLAAEHSGWDLEYWVYESELSEAHVCRAEPPSL